MIKLKDQLLENVHMLQANLAMAIRYLEQSAKLLEASERTYSSTSAAREIVHSFTIHVQTLKKQLVKFAKEENSKGTVHEAEAETGWGEWRTKQSDQPHADGI